MSDDWEVRMSYAQLRAMMAEIDRLRAALRALSATVEATLAFEPAENTFEMHVADDIDILAET